MKIDKRCFAESRCEEERSSSTEPETGVDSEVGRTEGDTEMVSFTKRGGNFV